MHKTIDLYTLAIEGLQARALEINNQIATLRMELDDLVGAPKRGRPGKVADVVPEDPNQPRKRRKMSPAARKRIAEAQKKRWAKFRKEKKANAKAAA